MTEPRVAIVGVGHTEFARNIPDKTNQRLQVEAAAKAVADAGLKMRDIDGLVCMDGGSMNSNPRYHMELSEVLGLFDTPLCTTTNQGGASAGYAVEIARWALQAGRVKNVLVVDGFKESSQGRTQHGNAMTSNLSVTPIHYPNYEHPYGALMASFYAIIAQRHMHDFGTTEEQLASVPVATRYNASLNPDAVYRKLITHEDVLNSKVISTPFHMLHCCMVNDGGVAFVLSTEERARTYRKPPVYVIGSGGGESGYWTGFITNGDHLGHYNLTRTLAEHAANEAFAEAGVNRKDIDFVTCCDNFAITPLVLLEDFGFCKKGEGGPFIGNGDRIKVGGDLPVNPHGGMLSCNHAATELLNYVEAALQLRGEAGDRQVKGAELALASATAGIISTHYAQVLSKN